MTTKKDEERKTFEEAARQAGEKAKAAYENVEAKTDKAVEKAETGLARLRKSPYTTAGVLGSILAAAFWFFR